MGKITVKHYLNKTVKPIFNGKTNTYPIYVQIIADRVNYKMKSNFGFWDGYINDSDFSSDFVQNSLEREKLELERVASYLIDHKKTIFLNANGFKKLSSSLWNALNYNFWKVFIREAELYSKYTIPNVFYNATFFDIDEILNFTESEIESDFSREYEYAKDGVIALKRSLFDKEQRDLDILKVTVFDFLFNSQIRENVHESVWNSIGYSEGRDSEEYDKVLKELEQIALMD